MLHRRLAVASIAGHDRRARHSDRPLDVSVGEGPEGVTHLSHQEQAHIRWRSCTAEHVGIRQISETIARARASRHQTRSNIRK